jgi:hypothetical protein
MQHRNIKLNTQHVNTERETPVIDTAPPYFLVGEVARLHGAAVNRDLHCWKEPVKGKVVPVLN